MRTVFFVSNRTAITAETLGHSLLAQFDEMDFRELTIPYVDNPERADAVAQQIARAAAEDEVRPIVFATLAEPAVRDRIMASEALVIDAFHTFLQPLEAELNAAPHQHSGRSHRISDIGRYDSRINAINYTLLHDDGADVSHYDQSDLILIGISRSGKTPTCLYLALHFGLRVANYPVTEEDLRGEDLPPVLLPERRKLYGLTTTPERLRNVRSQRRPRSRYASLEQCQFEVRAAEALYRGAGLRFLSTETRSVEEIATRIVQETGLRRYGF